MRPLLLAILFLCAPLAAAKAPSPGLHAALQPRALPVATTHPFELRLAQPLAPWTLQSAQVSAGPGLQLTPGQGNASLAQGRLLFNAPSRHLLFSARSQASGQRWVQVDCVLSDALGRTLSARRRFRLWAKPALTAQDRRNAIVSGALGRSATDPELSAAERDGLSRNVWEKEERARQLGPPEIGKAP